MKHQILPIINIGCFWNARQQYPELKISKLGFRNIKIGIIKNAEGGPIYTGLPKAFQEYSGLHKNIVDFKMHIWYTLFVLSSYFQIVLLKKYTILDANWSAISVT